MLSRCSIKLSRFIDSSPKNISIYIHIIFYQQCKMFFHCLTLSFIVIHSYKKPNSFELNKNVILKTFISTFECYLERHRFGSVINSAKLLQKLSSDQFFFFPENNKMQSNSRFLKYYIRVYQRQKK